jgi:hypothetical protein
MVALTPTSAVKQSAQERQPETNWTIESESDRQAVLEQLERLLASPAFHASKRLSGFLRYVVEETITNGGHDLKERVIGVKVFGRSPDYDTSAEPVVRVSAGDVRKRIAQYYYEPGHAGELRIDLPSGSYHPVFHRPVTAPDSALVSTSVIVPATASQPEPPDAPSVPFASHYLSTSTRRRVFAIAGLSAATGLGALFAMRSPGNSYNQFWGPVVTEKGPVLIYAGRRPDDGHIVYEDAMALVSLSRNLHEHRKPYRILKEADLTPETMKQGPSLLIGGFTNPIVRRLTQQLRFTFAREGEENEGFAFIQDRQNPNNKNWKVPIGKAETFTDYAIVSRVVDPVTDRFAVVSAGIRKFGTMGAAEFLSRPEHLEALASQAPRDWRDKDMQAVLAIDVKDGNVLPARVVASYFW